MKKIVILLSCFISLISFSQNLNIGSNQTYNTTGNANYVNITIGNNSIFNVNTNHTINASGSLTSNNGIAINIYQNALLNVSGLLTGNNNIQLNVLGEVIFGGIDINNNGILSIVGSGQVTVTNDITAENGTTIDVDFDGTLNVGGNLVVDENTSSINVDGNIIIGGYYTGPAFTGAGTVTENGVVIYPVSLPVQFLGMSVTTDNSGYNHITWSTFSELNSSHFILEKTTDGNDWIVVSVIGASGTSNHKIEYNSVDKTTEPIINYYRLKQYDFDGTHTTFDVISVDNTKNELKIVKILNLLGQEVDLLSKGAVIVIYNDGTRKKVINP